MQTTQKHRNVKRTNLISGIARAVFNYANRKRETDQCDVTGLMHTK